jgi:hypothetical protein
MPAGEANGTTVMSKISGMDQQAVILGLPLPIR